MDPGDEEILKLGACEVPEVPDVDDAGTNTFAEHLVNTLFGFSFCNLANWVRVYTLERREYL